MKSFLLAGLLATACIAAAQQPLFIPDTLSGTSFSLTMHRDSVAFLPGAKTPTLAFNQYTYLGPTLIFRKGDVVNLSVKNEIGDTTTVHWHGLHVPAKWDGGPHTMIMNGDTWNPSFTVMDHAATYWYHPHFHGKTAEQAIKGAAGIILVRDEEEAQLNLPRTYGIDDFPVVMQCKQLDSVNRFMPRGMQDSSLFVNGTINPYLQVPAQVVRLRLLNASGERSFNVGFTNNQSFYVIGTDGGLLPAPVATTRVPLSPGERAEILLDLSSMNGQQFYLMSYASEFPNTIQGGPTMPMPPGEPPMDSPLNGIDFNILRIDVQPQTNTPVTTVPSSLVTLNKWNESSADITRTITITGETPTTMDGPFYFNNQLFDMMRIDYEVPLNNTEIWTISNQSMMAHPFHIHDVQFYILDRDGIFPAPKEAGRKDVVMVNSNETVRFIAKFEDFTDSIIPYMYHCHILMHEDDGMMGQFIVGEGGMMGVNELAQKNDALLVYPNPAIDGTINIELQNKNLSIQQVEVIDVLGRVVKHIPVTDHATGSIFISTEGMNKGTYFIRCISSEGLFTSHFVKQ